MRIEERMTDEAMTVRVEIPGVDPEKDIEIAVDDDGTLTISAQRETSTDEKQEGMVRSEFHYGRFLRQIRVPKNADLTALIAHYGDGVLDITVPLRAEAVGSSRKVEITRS